MRTAGCNPAHRVGPLAMPTHLPEDALPMLARQEAKLTHWDPLAGKVSAAVVVLCRSPVWREDWKTSLLRASRHCDGLNQEADGDKTEPPLSPGGSAPEVLRAAVFFVGKSADLETPLA